MPDRTALARRLDEYVTELAASDPDASFADVRPLADAFAGARVVGLGEATHGTREFSRLKHRLVRFLVTELDYRLFGLEAGVAEARAVDDYVARGEGDPREALQGLHLWPWNTEELLALVEWLREFNADRPVADRVRFYGFDAQFVDAAAAALREYLAVADPAFLEHVDDGLCTLESEDVRGKRMKVAAEHVDAAEATVADLAARFERRADEYVARTSREAFELARRHLRSIEQATAFASASYGADEPHGAVSLRDEHMAENVSWILDFEDADRIAIWAHNAHLAKGWTEGLWESFTPMGRHLAERFGDDYRVVGCDFDRGSFRATPDPLHVDNPEPRAFTVGPLRENARYRDGEWSPDTSVAEALAGLDADPLFLDVAAAADDSVLREWLARRHPVRDVGTAYFDEGGHFEGFRLPAEMDGLLFVEESTPTVLVDEESGD